MPILLDSTYGPATADVPPPSRSMILPGPLRDASLSWLAAAAGATVALTGAMLPFRTQLGVLNVLLLYLVLTVFLALSGGLWAAVLSAVLGFLAFDFFFLPPYLNLNVAATDHVLALFVYLGVAGVTAQLVSRLRAQSEEARRESRRTALLAELNAALIGDITLEAVLERIAERVVTVYGAEGCRVLVPTADGDLRTGAFFPPRIGPEVDRTGRSLAAWALANRKPVGRSGRGGRIVGRTRDAAVSFPGRGPDVVYLPIKTNEREVGVLEVSGRPGKAAFRPEDEQTLTAFVDQAALALERARLGEAAARASALAESDEFKSTLLATVSHDLRTPLTAIKAAATSLLDDSVEWDGDTRHDLLEAIDEETDRLALLVSNLLDLSRIEGGTLRSQQDWYDVDELIRDVRSRVAARDGDHPLTVESAPDLPALRFDYVQIAQVLVNLLENAVKYTPAGTPIVVSARRVPRAVEIAVRDEGPGILPENQARLFDKFYRTPASETAPGSGLGLAIAKGLVEANGGRIGLESGPGLGTTFRFTLPLTPPSEVTPSAFVTDSARRAR